jgi:chorismate-pyruvate lyase
LSRTYDIIHNDLVLIRISEMFPSTSFVQTAVEGP